MLSVFPSVQVRCPEVSEKAVVLGGFPRNPSPKIRRAQHQENSTGIPNRADIEVERLPSPKVLTQIQAAKSQITLCSSAKAQQKRTTKVDLGGSFCPYRSCCLRNQSLFECANQGRRQHIQVADVIVVDHHLKGRTMLCTRRRCYLIIRPIRSTSKNES